MITLAMDSSSKTSSVAIIQDEKILCELFLNVGLTHSQTLMPMVQNAFSLTGIREIDKIAVTVGPGSFTGVRIAVSSAKGLAMVKNIPCYAVSALEALAFNAISLAKNVKICAMIDARLNRAYYAIFELTNGEITRVTEDDCAEFSVISEKIDENTVLVGDAVDLFLVKYPNFKANFSKKDMDIKAVSVELASRNKEELTAEMLNPVYLQMPQAQRERLEKIKN
ncbi:MAG: tRNA (adenosine(37)-N6)-threonylcarbamoyltransferase complex dimerization subunit type 1 TsaB [Clostridia bacterium]